MTDLDARAKPFLCRFGIHSWHMWLGESLGFGLFRQSYRCRLCKAEKVIKFERNI